MKKFIIFIFLLLSLIPTSAQYDDYITEAVEDCQAIATLLDTHELCDEFIRCKYETRGNNCFDTLVITLLDQCRNQDFTICEERSLFYAVRLDEHLPRDSMAEVFLADAMSLFEIDEFAFAASSLQNLGNEANYFPFFTHELLMGIVQLQLNEPQAALTHFSNSIAIQYDNPWAFYFRAQTYQALANLELASRDAYTYELLASEELIQAFSPLRLYYEIPDLEDWIAYPVQASGGSPAGGFLQDLTLRSSIPVKLAFLDNDTALAISTIETESSDLTFLNLSPEIENEFIISREVQGISGMLGGGESFITITINPDFMLYTLTGYGSESMSTREGVLLPSDLPDPRIALENRICEGLPLSFLSIGDETHSLYEFGVLGFMRDEPNNQAEIIDTGRSTLFTIEDGPICDEEHIWWFASNSSQSGWIPENYGTGYNLVPYYSFDKPQSTVPEILGLDNN